MKHQLFCVAISLSAPAPCFAVTLSGDLTSYIHSFNGTISAFDVLLDGSLESTGAVTFSLDRSADPSHQLFMFDFDARQVTYQVDALVSAELLESLGQPKQKISLLFSGPISMISPTSLTPQVDTIVTISTGILNGSGAFGPGQILSGWSYSNIQITNITNNIRVDGNGNVIKSDCDANSKFDGKVDAKINDSGGAGTPPSISLPGGSTPAKGVGGGKICDVPSSIPLPGSSALYISSLAASFGFARLLRQLMRT